MNRYTKKGIAAQNNHHYFTLLFATFVLLLYLFCFLVLSSIGQKLIHYFIIKPNWLLDKVCWMFPGFWINIQYFGFASIIIIVQCSVFSVQSVIYRSCNFVNFLFFLSFRFVFGFSFVLLCSSAEICRLQTVCARIHYLLGSPYLFFVCHSLVLCSSLDALVPQIQVE